MESPTEIQGIDLLFKKLGHEITEIRTRALESISSKLKHGLIHDADIVQERQLMIRLLEWFNFTSSPKQDLVLELLDRLTKHSSACDLLVSLGAIPFFSKLRSDIDGNMRSQIDVIVDRLLHVTDKDIIQAMSGSRHCVYGNKRQLEDENEVKPVKHVTNYGYFTPHANEKSDDSASTITPPIPLVAANEYGPYRSAVPECFRFSGFPWHSLTGTDRHVLTSTGASLCSPSPHSVRNACAFLLDVIFRDFPPEIFLQRPAIIQTLLTLISSRPGGQLMSGALACLQALAEGLHARLHFYQDPTFYSPRQGLPFHCNSLPRSRLSGLDSFSESDLASRTEAEGARRLERSGGDGRDERSSSSSATNSIRTTPISQTRSRFPREELGSFTWNSTNDDSENDLSLLQRSTITAPHFCVSSLKAVIPSLKTESSRLALNIFQTCIPLVKLLSYSVRAEKLWTDKSVLTQNLQTQIRQLLEIAGDVLLYHYHMASSMPGNDISTQSNWTCKCWSKPESKMHRLAYQTLSSVVMELVQAVLPLDKASNVVKSQLGQALFVIACDQSSITQEVTEAASLYLEQSNSDKFDVVQQARKIVRSFEHTHLFLKDYQDVTETDVTYEIMELAESSINSLPYHSDTRHLKGIIRAISKVFFNVRIEEDGDANQLLDISRRILLRLLAHPLISIRRTVYDECLKLIRAGINVDAAAGNLGHTASYIARFLLAPEVLYEICCFGLGDSSRLVLHPAQEIMSLLLQGRLLVAEEVWDQLCATLCPVLPVLQAYTAETDLIQSAMKIYLSHSEHPDQEWDVEFIKASIRCLMLKHRISRSNAADQLMKFLSENESLPQITGLTDLLMVDTPLSLVPRSEADCFRIRRCVFQDDAVLRMLSVFRSTSTEKSIRVGALRQLATMLDDPELHRAFLDNGGLDSVSEKLKEMVRPHVSVLTDDAKPVLSSCITILKLLLRRDSGAREHLSCDFDLLIALLRAADLSRLMIASVSEVSVVIALLVFHNVLEMYPRPRDESLKVSEANACQVLELSLPATVLTRYQVPFLCPTHHTVSIHRTLVPLPSPSIDPLLSGPPLSALRIAWNLARYDGDVVRLCKEDQPKEMDETCDDFELSLTEEDHLSLVVSDPTVLSASLLDSIMASQSHSAASHSFSLIRIAMISPSKSLSLANSILSQKLDLWKTILGKFLRVAPSCYEDEVLLINLTALLDETFRAIENRGIENMDVVSKQFLLWFLEECLLSSDKNVQNLGHGSPLLRVLESSEPQPEPTSSTNEAHTSSVTIRRQLCKGILSLLSRTARMLRNHADKEATALFHRELRTVILLRLRLADAPQFYDVPSMEVTLDCLVHVSAARMSAGPDSHVDYEPTDKALLQQLISTLLEIVSAFHIRSGASNLSYMGKGVSKCATQCILHLSREVSTLGYLNWTNLLEYTLPSQPTDQAQNMDRLGLEWLVPLWSARDPQMRFSGFATAVTIAQTKIGAISLANSFLSCSGGIWNMTLCAALDHSECSAVREQAFNLLSNLISHKFDGPEIESPSWQGPVVQEETSGATRGGLPALLALLHHAHFYEHLDLILARYHPDATVRSPAEIIYDLPVDEGTLITDSTIPSIAGSGSEASNMSAITQSALSSQRPVYIPNKQESSSSGKASGGDEPKNIKIPSYSSSPANSLPNGWRSLTSPSLVSSICRFLSNLMVAAPHETLQSLMLNGALLSINSVLDAHRIQILFDKMSAASNEKGLNETVDNPKQLRRCLLARHLLQQHEAVARLLTLVLCADTSMASRLLSTDENITQNVLGVLAVEYKDDIWAEQVAQVRQSVLIFLCTALHQNMKQPLPLTVLRDWGIICACILSILIDDKRQDLQTVALRVLALLFRSEHTSKLMKGKNSLNLTWLLEKKKGSGCDVDDLVGSLVRIFEMLIVNRSAYIPGPSHHKLLACCHALQNLFACSTTAQKLALEVGFLERCLDELKSQHVCMTLQFTTIQANKSTSTLEPKSQSSCTENFDSYLQVINLFLALLNNLLLDFCEGKNAAASAGLAQILSLLWPWSSQFSSLLIPLLRLTVTYTANCSKACLSIVSGSSSNQPSVATALVRLCRDVHSMAMSRSKLPTPVLQLTFNALINGVSAHECRALMWKVNLLELFPASADRGQHPKRSKQQGILLDCWLRLILALSFHTDGQLNFLKIRDFLDIMIELYSSKVNNHVLLIIRNLCFHGPSKNRLSSNKSLVRLLLNGLNAEDDEVRTFTSTAIQSLLCNNQKAKVHLKGAGLTQNLQNALARLTLSSGRDTCESDSPFKKSLKTLLQIMQS